MNPRFLVARAFLRVESLHIWGLAARPAGMIFHPFIVRIKSRRTLWNVRPADFPARIFGIDIRSGIRDTNGCSEHGNQERGGEFHAVI